MQELEQIVALSREFGTGEYVKGGGGNTSVKNESTLWVKPSGTTLAGLTPQTFVKLDRARIDTLYEAETPAEPAAREELVKNLMAAAVEAGEGRPSVEAALHNVFEATFVVHTHPAVVNGLTCARDGEAVCRKLFPDALWVDYVDPGYTLCMEVRKRIGEYRAAHGAQPALVVLQNHGLFVAAQTAEDIRAHYRRVMARLADAYAAAGIATVLDVADSPRAPETEQTIRTLFGADAAEVASSGFFPCAEGPLTPDHLVYAKAFPFTSALTEEAARRYRAERGYAPRIVVAGDRVYGLGSTPKIAALALDTAQDGALVVQLARAFGGIHYMDARHREFIENWEVEAYRQKQV